VVLARAGNPSRSEAHRSPALDRRRSSHEGESPLRKPAGRGSIAAIAIATAFNKTARENRSRSLLLRGKVTACEPAAATPVDRHPSSRAARFGVIVRLLLRSPSRSFGHRTELMDFVDVSNPCAHAKRQNGQRHLESRLHWGSRSVS
jgi:hypothetical protein